MSKTKIHFFLDYGLCFWGADEDGGGSCGGILNEDLPLSKDTLQELELFLTEYDAFYGWGLPPYEEHDLEYCRRFNSRLKRVTDLIFPELADDFIICHDQPELTEDAEVLRDVKNRFAQAKERQKRFYKLDDDTDLLE